MSYRTDMEAAFEEWFQMRRKESFALGTRDSHDTLDKHPNWSMGLRGWMLEGWLGAVLWCRLCKREHEGPCVTSDTGEKP